MLVYWDISTEGSPEIAIEPWASAHWTTSPTRARALGKEVVASLKNHSLLEEESVRVFEGCFAKLGVDARR